MKNSKCFVTLFALAAAAAMGSASAQAPNGIGLDPDGDSNPATNTRLFMRIGDDAEAKLDPPFQIVTFEAARSQHNKPVPEEAVGGHVVKFSKGLNRQLCKGQLYFRYDTQCTYMAAPSGEMAALYSDDWGRPLRIRFDAPVCAAALALYPTGGKEGEEYRVTFQPYNSAERPLTPASFRFSWTNDTFRWRMMAGAYFLNEKAQRVDVNISSVTNPKKVVRFLIDDVAFINNDCTTTLADINAEVGAPPPAGLAPPAPEPVVVIAPAPPAPSPKPAEPPPPVVIQPIAPDQPLTPEPVSAKFDTIGSIEGVSVSMTDDRCIASVIFDSAALGGDASGPKDRAFTLPLRVVGGPADMTVEARGFVSSTAHSEVALSVNGQRRSLVDVPNADDYDFAATDKIEDVGDAGVFRVELKMDDQDPDQAAASILALDSLDFTLANCGQ